MAETTTPEGTRPSSEPSTRNPDILHRAWYRFGEYDQNAMIHQRVFHRRQFLILALGVIAVLLALTQAEFIGTTPPDQLAYIDSTKTWIAEAEDSLDTLNAAEAAALRETIEQRRGEIRVARWYQRLQHGIIVVPILISILIAVSNKLKAGQKWIMLRSAAESVKKEIYSYRASVGIYQPDPDRPSQTREARLADQLKTISDRLMKSVVNEAGIARYEGPIPPKIHQHSTEDNGFDDITAEQYLTLRLESQLDYFASKTKKLGLDLKYFQWMIYIAGGIGTFLAAIGLEIWVALTTALATSFITYLEYRQTENTLMLYNQVASDLDNIKNWWMALTPVEKANPDNKTLLVDQCEQALANELSGWVRNLTDALAQLQEKQAKQKDEPLTHEQLIAQVTRLKEEADEKKKKTRQMLEQLKDLLKDEEGSPQKEGA